MGRMTSHISWKRKFMFETTNQLPSILRIYHTFYHGLGIPLQPPLGSPSGLPLQVTRAKHFAPSGDFQLLPVEGMEDHGG